MPTKIISDLHGATEALRREVSPDDILLLLGDLVNIIDYTMMDGILVEIFGTEAVQQAVELRGAGRFDEAREVMARRRAGNEEEIGQRFLTLIHQEYSKVRDALPCLTYLILGNVDWPGVVEGLTSESVQFVDGKVIEIDGLRVGFVGGGLPTPMRVAGEIPEEEYDAKLEGLGEVDVVCSHVPPDVPELTFDTLAKRHERGSPKLLEYVKEFQPLAVYFGHIHQPLISSTHVGRTHLYNVGYFRRTERAFVLK